MAINLKRLIENDVHFGHLTSRWCPEMEPYIWGHKNNIHLIDISKTAHQLEKASKFLESIAAEGKTILWVGTKKAAQESIERIGRELNLPYVKHRWVGGTFTNSRQIGKAITNMLHYEDILSKSKDYLYGKKELSMFNKKLERLNKNVGGIRKLVWPVGAVVVVDVKKEHICVKEAIVRGIPIVAIVDTNSCPRGIDFVIPGNDDSPRSVAFLLDYLAQAAKQGQEIAQAKPQETLTTSVIFDSVFEEQSVLDEEDEEDTSKKRPRTGQGTRTVGTQKKPLSNKPRSAKPSIGEKQLVENEESSKDTKHKKVRSPNPADTIEEKSQESLSEVAKSSDNE